MSKTHIEMAALVIGMIFVAAPASAQSGGEDGPDPAPAASEQAPDRDGQPDAPDAIKGPWMDGVPAETQKAARAIFLEGNVLIKDTLFAKAAARYREAIALWQHPAFYFNLAIAQLALDQPIEAYHSLEQSLRYGEAPLGAHRHRQAGIHLQRLDRELARIEVVCDEPGATVTLDGTLLFEAPGRHAGHVRPGGHQLVVHKTGYLTETRQLVLSPGQRVAMAIELETLEQARESSRRWAGWKPWAVIGAGMVVGMAGAVVHWRADANFDAFDARFGELPCGRAADAIEDGCESGQVPPEAARTLDRARLQQRMAVSAYVVGGAMLATGLALVTLNRPRVKDATLEPLISPSITGVGVRLHF